MARNCEKQYGKLNRVILAKEKEEFEKKHPKRPHLSQLHTADEIKNWLPSIKKDLDFNLKQSQVICYPDRKITEHRSNVVQLEQDYKRFVRKMKQLDPAIKHVPWTDRPYEPKRQKTDNEQDLSSETAAPIPVENCFIETPILDRIEPRKLVSQVAVDCNLNLQDLPLDFKVFLPRIEGSSRLIDDSKKESRPRGKSLLFDEDSVCDTEQALRKIFGLTSTEKKEVGKTHTLIDSSSTNHNLVGYTNDSDSSENGD